MNLLSNLSGQTAFDERIISDAREGLTLSMMRFLGNSCKQSFTFVCNY